MNEIKKAIKQFKRWEECGWRNSEVPNTYMLILAKQALEKQLNGGWTSVSEKLPEENEWYIFQLKDNRVHEWYYANETLYMDCDNEEPINESSFTLNDVIAWQPLPESYKEE